ncbi:transport integral membrane protein [Streptomyces violarus]|uniref:Protein YobA n=1 Tax=Streptomyces violarus TaxID=67380 RepID=A0A7W5F2P2_9ACTN|nr:MULTISPECIES: copper resistance protein CopC [Streptomyces]MBB3077734.1 copper transport protein [Streptomyces violarus]WRU00081.1 copper resistance protein CopC [Streptomyces sp. CGMCC 4.1772]GHD32970.1 transport integral membrane protein [Streptomyces violarus]
MTQTIAPRVRTLVLLLLAAACALLAGAGPASAHAAVTGSDPGQGAVVQEAPARISLTFSEQVALSDDSLRVLDPDGKRVDTAKPSNVSGTTYAVPLKPGLPDGTYTVAYQVVSADSHPVAGAYTFSIGAPSKTSATVSQQATDDGAVGWLYGFGRYVSYAGFTVMAGGAAFVLACWRRGSGVRPVQRFVVSGWLALTAATLALLLLRGSYTGSGKVADIVDLSLLGQVLETKTGAALVSRLLLLAAAALFISVLFGAYDKREDPQEKRDLTFGLAVGGVVVAAGLAASWAMSEHASVGLQASLSMPVDVIHLLAVAAWLGGLGALLVALYRAPADAPVDASAVRRFSRVAFGSVLALIATGTYQSWRQLGSWSAFTDTRYGQLLLAKIALVVVLVGVAWISRRWTGRLVEAVPASAEREMARVGAGADASGTTAADASGDAPTGTNTDHDADERPVPEPADTQPDDTQPADTEPADAERAAQLARQQAARDTARQKQLRDADPNRFGLRRSVLAEAGIAVVLLAVTTVLTQTEPGRTEQEAKAAASSSASDSADAGASGALTLNMPFDTGGADGKGIVTVDLDPARVGDNEMHVYVERPNGRAFDIPEVKVDFTLKAKDIGPLPVVPDHIATGHWSANGVQIPMAGDWQVDVTVRTSDIDEVTVSKNAQIG